jgi:hypothetical protein
VEDCIKLTLPQINGGRIMPIETRWYLENRVTYSYFSGEITSAELQAMDSWMIARMDASPTMTIHHILDVQDITQPASARHTMQLKAPHHPRVGWTITIGSNHDAIVHFLTALVISAARVRYRDAATFEDALTLLQTLDPHLPDLQEHKAGFISTD